MGVNAKTSHHVDKFNCTLDCTGALTTISISHAFFNFHEHPFELYLHVTIPVSQPLTYFILALACILTVLNVLHGQHLQPDSAQDYLSQKQYTIESHYWKELKTPRLAVAKQL
ncbi:unnamed protein product [Hymenolepis diminuta]|uniref:Transmembrane protein n=1 Tax=Hymenolepis diminuta TaxID=6216 RepID=A0A0R3SYU9_HYMDI|nr:unnamed protein product [Hymenolepis diminuta]